VNYRVIGREFYLADAVTVARRLLGMILVNSQPRSQFVAGRIVETEAYAGTRDAACHSFGRVSRDSRHRTDVMFEAGGHAYVYLIYGMYNCFNIVANTPDKPEAVLIRALEPIEGLSEMACRRGVAPDELARLQGVKKLCSGPGKLAMAMGITRGHNGADLTSNCGLFIANADSYTDDAIAATPRINVDYAGEAALYPYRFVIRKSEFLSTRRFLRG
jgi:DNA-3-methyladenine glycosylase